VPDETLSGVRGLSTAFPIDQSYRVTDFGLLCSFVRLNTAGVSIRIAGGPPAAPVDADRHVRDSGTARPPVFWLLVPVVASGTNPARSIVWSVASGEPDVRLSGIRG